ncbi:DedA family protein, partial [Citrobacter amalonaticus]|nr:DedA family protein [Citrobacter amalonaticus]ELW9349337.1 DedA family protein [Citrobacter amalonaticus]
HYLPKRRLLWLAPIVLGMGIVALVTLLRHPLMPMYLDILQKVVGY